VVNSILEYWVVYRVHLRNVGPKCWSWPYELPLTEKFLLFSHN